MKAHYTFAIDTTSVPVKPTGIGNYVLNLTKSLIPLIQQEKHRFLIFCRDDQVHFDQFQGGELIACGNMGVAKRVLWEQLVFPRIIKRHNVDVLHSPNYTIPLLARCRKVCTIHDLTCFLFPHRRPFFHGFFYRTMMKLSVRFADCIVADSQNTVQDINRKIGALYKKIGVVYPGIDEIFSPAPANSIENYLQKFRLESNKYFLFVSTFEPSKNIERLIEAFTRFSNEVDNSISLVLVGKPGWKYKKTFQNIMTARNVPIIHLGFVENEDLVKLYTGALAFIYPSLYEGFGLPPLEAMACETAVICSNISSIPESAGNAALYFDPYDSKDIFVTMKRLYKNPSLINSQIRKGKDRLINFSWGKSAKNIYKQYIKLAEF